MELEFFTEADLDYTIEHDWVPLTEASYRHKVQNGDQVKLYLVQCLRDGVEFLKVGLTKYADPLRRDRKTYLRVLACRDIKVSLVDEEFRKGNLPIVEGIVLGRCRVFTGCLSVSGLGNWAGASESLPLFEPQQQLIDCFNDAVDEAIDLVERHGIRRFRDEHHLVWIFRTCPKFGGVDSASFYWPYFKPEGDKKEWRKLLRELYADFEQRKGLAGTV